MYVRIGIIVSLLNYVLFFGPGFFTNQVQRQKSASRREKFERSLLSGDEAMNRCVVCGRTEITHPNLDFRVTSDGKDYCVEHLPKAGN